MFVIIVFGVLVGGIYSERCQGTNSQCIRKLELENSCNTKPYCKYEKLSDLIDYCKKDLHCSNEEITNLENKVKDLRKNLYK